MSAPSACIAFADRVSSAATQRRAMGASRSAPSLRVWPAWAFTCAGAGAAGLGEGEGGDLGDRRPRPPVDVVVPVVACLAAPVPAGGDERPGAVLAVAA